jgi:hypothetical protein
MSYGAAMPQHPGLSQREARLLPTGASSAFDCLKDFSTMPRISTVASLYVHIQFAAQGNLPTPE